MQLFLSIFLYFYFKTFHEDYIYKLSKLRFVAGFNHLLKTHLTNEVLRHFFSVQLVARVIFELNYNRFICRES